VGTTTRLSSLSLSISFGGHEFTIEWRIEGMEEVQLEAPSTMHEKMLVVCNH
jgi:hypothetical protein